MGAQVEDSAGPSTDGRPVGRDEVVRAAIAAAADLFAQHNPSQVSVREIAARAGVSHALVHRYLGSKDDIFRAVLELDRQQAAEYWMKDHGMGRSTGTFDADLPPGRYLRTIMRAALDGVPMSADDMRLPRSNRMVEFLRTTGFPEPTDDRPFDFRFLFAAITALAAGMAVAEDFFLVQAGLEGEDPDYLHAELDRLMERIMMMGDITGSHPS